MVVATPRSLLFFIIEAPLERQYGPGNPFRIMRQLHLFRLLLNRHPIACQADLVGTSAKLLISCFPAGVDLD